MLVELQSRSTIAVIEDVHWADEATLNLLKFLGRRCARTRAKLIVAVGDDELGPNHPPRMVLGDPAASPDVRHLPLAPLSEMAVRTLVGQRVVDPIALHSQTAGNPFFVTEMLSSPGGELPTTVREAVLARAARRSASGQAVLQAAAVIGPHIEPSVLGEVTGAEARAVEEPLAIGVLVMQGELLAIRHELARQTILETLSPPRKLALHQMTLDALKKSSVTRTDVTRPAHRAAGTGEREAILEFAPAAAMHAAAASAHRAASDLYKLALQCADDLPPAERAELWEAYARECEHLEPHARRPLRRGG